MKQHDLSYWEDLAERYFLAETSEREEAQLRKFLSTGAASDPRFDEIRATMSLLHVAKASAQNSFPEVEGSPAAKASPLRGRSLERGLRLHSLLAAVAAFLCLAAFLGWHHYQQNNMSRVRIAGEDVEADASLLMQRQMTEMFNPIDPTDR